MSLFVALNDGLQSVCRRSLWEFSGYVRAWALTISVENDRAAKLAAIPAGESPANRDAMGSGEDIASIGADVNRWSTTIELFPS